MYGYPFPGVGVTFDIDGLGGGYYGYHAWLGFMRTLPGTRIRACVLVEGDTLATLDGSAREFCIGVYGSQHAVEEVRTAFSDADLPGLAAFHRRFIEKTALDHQPLAQKGMTDAAGRLVTERWTRVDHDLCRETGWGYMPQSVPESLEPTLRTQLDDLMRVRLP